MYDMPLKIYWFAIFYSEDNKAKGKGTKKKAAGKRGKAAASEDEDEDDEPPKGRRTANKKKAAQADEEDSDDDIPQRRSAGNRRRGKVRESGRDGENEKSGTKNRRGGKKKQKDGKGKGKDKDNDKDSDKDEKKKKNSRYADTNGHMIELNNLLIITYFINSSRHINQEITECKLQLSWNSYYRFFVRKYMLNYSRLSI